MRYYIFICLMAMNGATECLAQDWAGLERYREANLALSSMDITPQVVLMGNSITEGWVTMRPEFWTSHRDFVGRGISGQTTPQMLIRMRQDVIHLRPEIVVILAGTNDIAGNTGPMTLLEIMGNIKSMTEIAAANDIKVILCSVLPAFDYPWKPGLFPNVKIPKLNAMIREYAEEEGHVYLDYFSAMADDRNGLPKIYADDEVHPTVAGYEVMEPLLLAAINQVRNR